MATVFTIVPRSVEWIEGARVTIDLAIENTGDTLIEVPNPTYATSPQPEFTVVRPGGEQVRFVPDRGRARGQVSLIRIAPGGTWRGDLSPAAWVDLGGTGDYLISARLDWNGIRATADAVRFRIVPSQIEALSSSISRPAHGSTVLECVMLQHGPDRLTALAALLVERDSKNGEMRAPDLQLRGTLPEGTTSVDGVFANYAVGLDPNRWIVSSTPERIHVATNLDATVTEVSASTPVRSMLTPLATTGRRLHILAILGERINAQLALAGIDRSGEVPAAVPLRTILTLQGPPTATAAALAPENVGAVFVVAILSRTTDGARLQLVQVRPDGATPAVTQHIFDRVTPVGGLAVHWSSDRRIRAAFLGRLSVEDALPRLQITEVEFDADLTDNAVARRIPVAIDTAIDDACVSYFERSPGEVSRAVIARADGAAWLAADGRPARRTALPATGMYTLIPGMAFWYGVWIVDGKLIVQAL